MKKLILSIIAIISIHYAEGQCWQSVSTGCYHTLAIKVDGSLWAWGSDSKGELGDGTNTKYVYSPIQTGRDTNWQFVSGGNGSTYAIKTDGSLWSWGINLSGELGNGTNTKTNTPIQIGRDTNWKSVSAGNSSTFALKTDGTLWAWGKNDYGQLGNGTNTNSNIPIQVGSETNWQTVSAGREWYTLAIKTDGTLWAWGDNIYGQLGNGTFTETNIPIQIGSATNWQNVNAGGIAHNLGIRTDGTLWAWGYNQFGQLGDGTYTDKNTPIQIGSAMNWQSLSAGPEQSFAIARDGTLWAWGYNFHGLLGDGTTIDKNTPTKIGSSTNWQSISGFRHHLVIKTDGTLWAWGNNDYGQLGDGSLRSKDTSKYINSTNCSPLSVDYLSTKSIQITPNPSNQIVSIVGLEDIEKIDIINMQGQIVQIIMNNNQSSISFNISQLQAGMYALKMSGKHELQIVRLIVEH